MKDVDAIRVKAANAVTALADLNATLAASYQNDVHVLRETVELQGKELGILRHMTGEQGRELNALRDANHSLARNCTEESNRASALQAELNSASSKLKIAAEYERELKELIVDIRREEGEAKEQLAKAETKNQELSAEFAKASEALAKYDEQSEFHKWTNGDFAKQIAEVREERDALREANDSQSERIARPMKELAEVKEEFIRKAFVEGHKHDESLAKMKDELDACKKEYVAAKEEIVVLNRRLAKYEGDIEGLI